LTRNAGISIASLVLGSKGAIMSAAKIIEDWPHESREAAQAVIDKYGEPDEATQHLLIWYQRRHWKKIVASKEFYRHDFPMPHTDSVQCFIDYRIPVSKFTPIGEFDGSVIVEHTAGEVSARCNDEEANCLALNLMHDIVIGAKNSQEARNYYASEVLSYRRKKATPYMEDLRFPLNGHNTGDPDTRILSDEILKRAIDEGKQAGSRL
jgi:hypothetical protein